MDASLKALTQRATAVLAIVLATGCATLPPDDAAMPTFRAGSSGAPLDVIAYGDMRFTDPAETEASNPAARQALVAKIADEHPAAVLLNGDVPWHGGVRADYAQYLAETKAWRDAQIPVFPALGNHEFAKCAEAECLENWWATFPELRGLRWYSVALSAGVWGVSLDSDSSLLPGSAQRLWLAQQLPHLPAKVRFVLISLHHPPVADAQTGKAADHNPRPNERALADYLAQLAPQVKARFIVVAGHIHNYEHFERDGVTWLVSGGGGAHPYTVLRAADDLYQDSAFPNFHYLRFAFQRDRVHVTMNRLDDTATPARWDVRDAFEIAAKPD